MNMTQSTAVCEKAPKTVSTKKTEPASRKRSGTVSKPISKATHDVEAKESNPKPVKTSKSRSSKELGRRGEEACAQYLKRKGYEILERNWTCFAGEADIICMDRGTLCFVEVKTRSSAKKGFPSEAVDASKRDRYEKIAACYLQDHEHDDMPVRFDVVSIMVLGPDSAFLRHHLNAFGSM